MLALMSERRHPDSIWISHFDYKATQDFYHQFLDLEKDPHVQIIVVYISSYGGEISSLIAMRDLIKSSSKPVATIAVGAAMSCGSALLAAGTKGFRFASKDTSIMIHEAASGDMDKASNMKVSTEYLLSLNKLMLENYDSDMGKKVGFTSSQILKNYNTDWFLTAQQAKELGLIDHITVPRIGALPSESYLTSTSPYSAQKKKKQAVKPEQKPAAPVKRKRK